MEAPMVYHDAAESFKTRGMPSLYSAEGHAGVEIDKTAVAQKDPSASLVRLRNYTSKSKFGHQSEQANFKDLALRSPCSDIHTNSDLAISSAQVIPTDVVLEIAGQLRKSHSASLLAFSYVCSTWRSAVLSVRRLWTYLRVEVIELSESRSTAIATKLLIRNFFANSGGRFLSLDLSLQSHEEESREICTWLFRKWRLLPALRGLRIESVHPWSTIIKLRRPARFKYIETLTLTTWDKHARNTENYKWLGFLLDRCLRLRKLTFGEGVIDEMPSWEAEKFHFEILHHLRIDDEVDADVVIYILDDAHKLRFASFYVIGSIEEIRPTQTRISCPHLETLELSFSPNMNANLDIIEARIFPNVTHLSLEAVDGFDPPSVDRTAINLLPCFPKLYSLSLSGFSLFDTPQFDFLSQNNQLTDLSLELENDALDLICSYLTIQDGEVTLLPRISFLVIETWKNYQSKIQDVAVVEDMVYSRRNFLNPEGQHSLKRLRLIIASSSFEHCPEVRGEFKRLSERMESMDNFRMVFKVRNI